jgi:hypothetical protein
MKKSFFTNNTLKILIATLLIQTSVHPCATASLIENLSLQSRQSNQYTQSIAELAADAKTVVDAGIKEFNAETLPHEAKDLRKQIVRMRDIMDIFSHNFAHETDLWDDVRDGLDDGYTVVGDFKDLFDTNPEAVDSLSAGKEPKYKDEKKLKERRKKVLRWKSHYFAEGGLSEKIRAAFFEIRPLDSSNIVQSKKYSDFFWGGVNQLPLALNSPAQNARILVNAQSDLADAEHPVVLAIKDPSTHENEILFHNHRKRLRTIAKVCHVANAMNKHTCRGDSMKEIENLVTALGEIEDLIITGRHLEEDKKESKAEVAYEEAKKKFKKLKKEFEGKNMLEALDSL